MFQKNCEITIWCDAIAILSSYGSMEVGDLIDLIDHIKIRNQDLFTSDIREVINGKINDGKIILNRGRIIQYVPTVP